jgi:hypothetical protein
VPVSRISSWGRKPASSLHFKLVEKARSYQQEFDKPNPNS